MYSAATLLSPNSVRAVDDDEIEMTAPPSHLMGGAHFDLMANGTVTFIFYAPWKPFVSLVGDFNRWDTRTHPMRSDGTGRFWITLPFPGETRYGFYVAIDDTSHVWVGDPYATEVYWAEAGSANPAGAWAYLRRPSTFRWTDTNWKTPALREMVIYELCVRDFVGAWRENEHHYGTFHDLKGKVEYLASLGINAVEIMPVQAFPGDSSWGYNPVFYFAPAAAYGSADDLRAFVNACHAVGIAVILDVAFNHAWGDHPWYRIYPPMYDGRGVHLRDFNPFFHHTPPVVNAWGGVDWDHFVPDTTRYFQDVVRHWLREYHLDGFRFDWVCGVDYDSSNAMQPGFNVYAGISAIAWAAKDEKPDCVLIGEHWLLDGTHPDKTAAKLVHETPVDAAWNGDFHHVMEEVLNQRWQWERKDIKRAIGGFRDLGYRSAAQAINYTASHDEVRPEHEIHFYSARYMQRPRGWSLESLELALARLGLITLFASAGIPMIWSGQEFGDNSPRTIDFQPLQWWRLDDAPNRAHFELVRRLIGARRDHASLQSDNVSFDWQEFSGSKLVQFWRWESVAEGAQGDAAAVALNFAPITRRVTVDLPYTGAWIDTVANESYIVQSSPLVMTLPPYGGALLVPARI
jgi:1,4-alpha-glucan branching enzyme